MAVVIRKICTSLKKALLKYYKTKIIRSPRLYDFIQKIHLRICKVKLCTTRILCVIIVCLIIMNCGRKIWNNCQIANLKKTLSQYPSAYGTLEKMKLLLKFQTLELSAISTSNCVVLLRESKGDLGERMFMFASAYGLARIHSCKMYVAQHILNELEATFDIWIPHLITKAEMKNLTGIISLKTVCQFYPELMRPNAIINFELIGFWFNYKYFIRFKSEILKQFDFRQPILKTVAQFFGFWGGKAKSFRFHCCSNSSIDITQKIYSESQTSYIKISEKQMNTGMLKQHMSESSITWIGIYVQRVKRNTDLLFSVAYILKSIEYYSAKYKNCLFIIAGESKEYYVHAFAKKKQRNLNS